ncbi:HEAT repeat domain-containing protein, partial [Chitinophaga sp.]|uniref:HEAT repeat domain-containing protein n=1 Tax=Chitinophaga sp. TaxID=1869181 RepID=UPI002F932847
FPQLDISYKYNDAAKTVTVILQQIQKEAKVWQIPMAIDIYAGGKAERHQIFMENRVDSFTFSYTTRPDLVNVDADKVVLAKIDDHRAFSTYAYQYAHAPNYMDRHIAIDEAADAQATNPEAVKLLQLALKDKYHGLRTYTIGKLNMANSAVKAAALPVLLELAKQDPSSLVRAAALQQLGELKDAQYTSLFEGATKDKSYGVEAAGLEGLASLDLDKAYAIAKQMEGDTKGKLVNAIAGVYARKGNAADVGFVATKFDETSGQDKLNAAFDYLGFLSKVNNTAAVTKGVDQVKAMTAQFSNPQVSTYISNWMQEISKSKSQEATSVTGTNRDELLKQSEYMRKAAEEIRKSIKE